MSENAAGVLERQPRIAGKEILVGPVADVAHEVHFPARSGEERLVDPGGVEASNYDNLII
jgi:hypothetical protein